jgi:putative transposase
MPWRVKTVTSQRWKFVQEVLKKVDKVAAICRRYGVSRTLAYKWTGRLLEEGRKGLKDRSRAPHRQALATDAAVERLVVKLRRKYGWGARKLWKMLAPYKLGKRRPSVSTISAILKRRGLVKVRLRRHRVPLWQGKFTRADRCNRVWRADYKGYFWAGDGTRNEPLTVTDGRSRFLVVLKRCNGTGEEEARRAFDAAFKRYGLPQVILTDNGNPFATPSLTGLTRLGVWWIKLGIRHERIDPGKPYQNGSHERFHGTLKQATCSPPAPTLVSQDRRFARFRHVYNEIRPHEALGQQTPASIYRPSSRKLPRRLPAPQYPSSMQQRRVRGNGTIKWQGSLLYVGIVLAGELLGIRPRPAGAEPEIYFYDRLLGTIGERASAIFLRSTPPPPRGRRRAARPRPSRKV